MNADTVADLPPRDPLLLAYDAAIARTSAHMAVCRGCQLDWPCPVLRRLKVEEQLEIDAACRAMLGGQP